MRTTEIKIAGEKREALLVAGGSGFRVYSVADAEGWALVLGRRVEFIAEKSELSQVVADYVNVKYHAIQAQKEIQQRFEALVDSLLQNPNSSSETRRQFLDSSSSRS